MLAPMLYVLRVLSPIHSLGSRLDFAGSMLLKAQADRYQTPLAAAVQAAQDCNSTNAVARAHGLTGAA